jgi:hypothetical protein
MAWVKFYTIMYELFVVYAHWHRRFYCNYTFAYIFKYIFTYIYYITYILHTFTILYI